MTTTTMTSELGGVLPPERRTLPALLQRQGDCFGERPFVSVGGAQWTHADAPRMAAARAGALARQGIVRGDRVAVMSGNRIEVLELLAGCGWMGAALVPINTASMGPQIQYLLANSGARLLVIEADFVERLAALDLGQTELAAIWVLDGAAPAMQADVALSAWPAAAAPVSAAPVGPGDTLAILYTSGTTGPAKGVRCPHGQYFWWGVNTAEVLGVHAGDVLCSTLPLFHINALNTFAQAAVTGCKAVFEARFSASGFWPAMCRHEATVVYLLGAMVPILLAQPEGGGERAHRVRIGLGPGVPARAARQFRERTGVRLLEGYGSTETNFVIATAPDSPRDGVMGWLRPGFAARVVDERDTPLPDGQAGELLLRAEAPDAFADGYFNMPEETAAAQRGGWFHTGDRVVREADGAFRFIDRIKDAIRRRGENISSWEVEQVLSSHPAVESVAVFPVRSELAEDEVMAALTVRAGHALDLAELSSFCRARLPYFAVPRYYDVLAALPRTENGKVQKFKLRERGVGESTWDAGPSAGRRP